VGDNDLGMGVDGGLGVIGLQPIAM
jgi:hypothetical protein